MRAVVRSVFAVACAAAVLSCSDSTAPLTGIQQYLAKVALAGGTVTATLVRGNPPTAAAGPTVAATAPSQAINGGSSEVGLTSADQFTVVIIAVDGQSDYYQLALPAATNAANLVITLAQQIPTASFTLSLAAGASATTIGAYASQSVALVTVGTGDVQVSVSWNTAADVDLHVVDPSGEEIYYGNSTAASTNYVVTVYVKGKSPQTFTGSFNGTGDQGGLGDGTLITTFTK